MNIPVIAPRLEPRWPIALAILFLLLLIVLLPDHMRLLPRWTPFVVAGIAWFPMALVTYGADNPRWLRIESTTLTVVAVFVLTVTATELVVLIRHIVSGSSPMGGLELLASSVIVWMCNVVAFSLLFWQVDRGGPAGRMGGSIAQPDWLFPQAGVAEITSSGWQPMFADYLFLSFSTATAFSATDSLPLTVRAKLMMMLQAMISLVTMVVVASRAINVLAS
jgi:hypothetical protein